MDLALDEEQLMFKNTARQFLERECSKTLVRELADTPQGHSPLLWQRMVDLGWLGLPFPEEYGGCGSRFLDLALILEEMGRALVPGPFFSTMLLGAYPILDAGSEQQKSDLLPLVSKGELILTMAWLEDNAAYAPEEVSLAANESANGFVLSGAKLFVPNADIADIILTVARVPHSDGVTIFLVDRHSGGIECMPLQMIDGSKCYEVQYRDVAVTPRQVLGTVGGAADVLDRTLARAAVGESLQLIGGAQAALEMAIEHVKNRVQFNQAVGQFQAVQHHCANMATDLDGARFLAYKAAWTLSEGMPARPAVAMAKAWVSDACYRIISNAHQVHGGVGFISEHDLTMYFKRIEVGEPAYGGSNFHYRALAQALGL